MGPQPPGPASSTAGEDRARRSGISVVGDLPWGTHICHFYQDPSDLVEAVIPFFRAGLEDNEFCLWVTCGPLDVRAAERELRATLPHGQLQLEAGDIEIVSCEDWQRQKNRFDAERLVAGWSERLDTALTRGFAGMRVQVNSAWLTRTTWPAFRELEQSLNDVLASMRIIVMCSYPLDGSAGGEIFDVAGTHQFAIARRRGAWEVLESARSVAARAEMERLNADLEQRIEERTRELAGANTALRESEELYRFLAENTNDVITLVSLEGHRVYASPSAGRVLGEIPSDTFSRVHPEDLPKARAAWNRILAGESMAVTYRYAHANGSWRWLESWNTLVRYRGEPHVLTTTRDVTERKGLEEQLRQAQRLEAVGRLAGGIAHDFNNVLHVIAGSTQLLQMELVRGTQAAEDATEILRAADRGASLVQQLLAFSRKQVLRPLKVDLRELIREVQSMLGRLLGEDIRLETRLSPKLGAVTADPGQLHQVILNLAVNARDAMPHGGGLTIAAENTELTPGQAQGYPYKVSPGRYVRLTVRDTGTGMSQEVQRQIFEPFFTTKEPGKGTGLGLSTVYGIVKQSGGYIWAQSELGRGTTFDIYLPRVEGAPETEERHPPPPLPSGGGETVLVVEDDEALRTLTHRMLRQSGYAVLAASNGEEALALAAQQAGTIDLLLTDVIMPGMNGRMLAEHLTERFPNLRVVYMSGYLDHEISHHGVLDAGVHLLQKPFRAETLLGMVRTLLSERC